MAAEERPQNTPQAFGEELKRLRESTGFSIDDVMAETKVSRRILESLESGSFQYLPDKVFSRNFVRQYASTIGVDEHRLVERFDAAWERFLLASGSHPALLVEVEPPRPSWQWRFWLPIAVGALIIIVALLVIVGMEEPEAQLLGNAGGASLFSPTPRRQPTAVASPVQQAVTQLTPPPEDVRGSEVSFSVRVRPDAECWLHYRDRDGRTEQTLLRGGDQTALTLDGPVVLTIGNAASAILEVGGRTYGDLGAAGQVVHLEVARDGVRRVGGGGAAGD